MDSTKVQDNTTMITKFIRLTLKYFIEGMVIAVCAYYIPLMFKSSLRKPTFNEIFSIGLTASLTMLILDSFSETTSMGLRLGAGFGIGKNLISM